MPFKPGQSGNPHGRKAGSPNKATAELRQFAGKYAKEAVTGLLAIARNEDMPPQARVGAWREILDRAVGKAPQALVDTDGNDLSIPQTIAFLISKVPGADCRD